VRAGSGSSGRRECERRRARLSRARQKGGSEGRGDGRREVYPILEGGREGQTEREGRGVGVGKREREREREGGEECVSFPSFPSLSLSLSVSLSLLPFPLRRDLSLPSRARSRRV